jgi:hypothetical protein
MKKKNIVLFIAFLLLPIVAYLFFCYWVKGFTKLPVITLRLPDFGVRSLDGKKVTLNNKITVLGFWFLIFWNRGD